MVERETLIAMVRGMQNGDSEAAAQMYEAFQDDIYYFILKTVKNDRELAEDLMQDTFVKIIEDIQVLEEPAAFVTWAKQIAYHKCTDYFKKHKELLLDENEDGTTAFDIQMEENAEFIPDEALDNKELKQTILEMINELPKEQRSALVLRYFNEVSVKEIAEIQNTSEGTVKSRLNYARKSLKQAIETYEKKNGIKLHCVGVLPLLLWMFREYRMANDLSMAAGTAAQEFVLAEETAAAAAAAASGATAAGTTVTTAGTTAVAGTSAATVGAATATTAAGKVVAGTGIKAIAGALSTKIVAGVVAASVAVGGVAVGIHTGAKKNAEASKPETAIVQAMEETEEPAAAEATKPSEAAEKTMEPTKAAEKTKATEKTTEASAEKPAESDKPTEAQTDAATNPKACEYHTWEENYFDADRGMTVYECAVCGEIKGVYSGECVHPSYTQEYWTDPNDGMVYTFHICTECGDTYSTSGTFGEPDYATGSGAPDGYYEQQTPTETPEESEECSHPDWIYEIVIDESVGMRYDIHTCSACGYSYTESESFAVEEEPCAHANTYASYYDKAYYDLICEDCLEVVEYGLYDPSADVETGCAHENIYAAYYVPPYYDLICEDCGVLIEGGIYDENYSGEET